ncbi:hypothetical protein [Methylobacterium dankookense]|uniref:Uncharacterized protein n=1 Tax=Methylobacterium dankookense TaxID=560405 RepID=A0A564FT44_9HYPH|nr:hypothetical protein [Methylobacterium dankookense]GJD56078.1 hypothetical protein IFDJLNFL_1970 [Methylobacterium dankookense]VUF10936.1 hypothetical protein MTDSW087_00608 [Methylobacterium dankookense]
MAGLSILTIGFVAADRLSHLAPPPVVAKVMPEPSATGSIAVPKPVAPVAAVKAPPKIPNGFDTERLNALMRGDPILPPSKR